MAEDVTLPQLGESVSEGIITQWLVEVGDEVEVDQPLVEISTDKVDTEIPSPVAGVVQELRGEVDDEIEVGEVIAVIGDPEDADAGDEDTGEEAEETADGDTGEEAEETSADEETAAGEAEREAPSGDEQEQARDEQPEPSGGTTAAAVAGDRGAEEREPTGAAGEGTVTSPIVRKMLRENDIDPARVRPTGEGGRITRQDAERAIASGGEEPAAEPEAEDRAPAGAPSEPTTEAGREAPRPAAAVTPPPAVPAGGRQERERPSPSHQQVDFGGEREVTQDLSRVRRAIARGMKSSLDTSAQLTAIVEVDMTAVMNLRAAYKDAFKARHGASLSPLPFVCRAVTRTLPRHPALNGSIDMEAGTATYRRYINLGIAVDTERGLLVPNVKDAQDLTVAGLAKRIADVAKRTRGKGLTPDEISGGTFTVTNTGSLGTLMDTPIINPPEVGILGAAAVEKRPVVVSDAYGDSIAIRWMTYMCLSYDHQMLDGADAARFLQDLKWVLETTDFSQELDL